jgi:hypothetical protein
MICVIGGCLRCRVVTNDPRFPTNYRENDIYQLNQDLLAEYITPETCDFGVGLLALTPSAAGIGPRTIGEYEQNPGYYMHEGIYLLPKGTRLQLRFLGYVTSLDVDVTVPNARILDGPLANKVHPD